MGTNHTRGYSTNINGEILSVPPGFVSLTSFTLKRMVTNPEVADSMAVDSEFNHGLIGPQFKKIRSSVIHKPWICGDQAHPNPNPNPPKCGSGQTEVDMNDPVNVSLPKGVIWGCANCDDCVKVTSRSKPEESCLPVVDDAPVFYPTEEEFRDTLKYVAKIRPRAEDYGICRIVPPNSWKPPCLLGDKKTWAASKFSTRVQKINELQHASLKRKLSTLHDMETKIPEVAAYVDFATCNKCEADCIEVKPLDATSEFITGPKFTLQSFKKNADAFKRQYFSENGKVQEQRGPLVARIEGEYWRIIDNATEEIEVLCGTNLGSQNLGTGFPTRSGPANDVAQYLEYVDSDWNLNNIQKLSGSLLRYGNYNNSVISVPQLSIGMCFSSQCWRTEDHHLYSLSYMHLGEPKVWYGISGRYCFKFMEIARKLFPELLRNPKLLHELACQLSPSMLISEGIPVFRCVQSPREFVLVFPRAYRSEFSCGFNCSESVCFAPFDWLPHGQNIVELYAGYSLKTSISHDKLLVGAALEAVHAQWEYLPTKTNSSNSQLWRSVCGKDGILTKALKARVKAECIRREYLCNSAQLKAFDERDVAAKMECSICSYDLYLSAVGCPCSPTRYSCLRHAKHFCSCPWLSKHFLFRHSKAGLDLLVKALEGNSDAIFYWVKTKARADALEKVNADAYKSSLRECNSRASHRNPSPPATAASDENGMTRGSCRKNLATSPSHDVVILLSDDDE